MPLIVPEAPLLRSKRLTRELAAGVPSPIVAITADVHGEVLAAKELTAWVTKSRDQAPTGTERLGIGADPA